MRSTAVRSRTRVGQKGAPAAITGRPFCFPHLENPIQRAAESHQRSDTNGRELSRENPRHIPRSCAAASRRNSAADLDELPLAMREAFVAVFFEDRPDVMRDEAERAQKEGG
jgi:hypothetical protein